MHTTCTSASRTRRARAPLPALAFVAVLVAACGSGDGDGDDAVPRVAPDHVEVHSYARGPAEFEGVEGGNVLDDDEGWLFGPFLELKIEETGVVDVFEPPDRAAYQAAEDHELVVTYFSADSQFGALSPVGGEREPDIEGGVEVGGEATPLDDLHLGDAAIVTSVPAGETPMLEVVHEGRSQTVDLVTGELVDASDGGYVPASQHIRYRYSGTGRKLEGAVNPRATEQEVEVSLEWMARTPWLPDRGYAPDGQAWLIAGPNTLPVDGMGGGTILDTDDLALGLRAGEVFVLEDEAGTEIPADRYLIQASAFPSGLVVFEVPESFTTGSLRVDVGAGTVWASGDPPTPVPWEHGWETPPPAESVEIELVEGTTAPAPVYETSTVDTHYVYD